MPIANLERSATDLPERGYIVACRLAAVAILAVGLAAYLRISWRWELMHDMQVLHYVSFLIDKGWAPYRQIGDMNMPGAYLFEGWALHVFGSSDLGWRLYDFLLCAVAIAAMVSIARPYDWLSGFIAGCTFTLVHAADGPVNAGQRDQLMAVLLLVSYAFCFESVRRRSSWPMAAASFCAGMAASVKPTLLLAGPVLFALALWRLRKIRVKLAPYVLWMLIGFLASAALVLGFLLLHGSLQAFVYDLTKVLPDYAKIPGATWPELIETTLSRPMFIYAAFALITLFLYRQWANWELGAIVCGIGFGLLNFYGQHKGFGQHRYTTNAFVILWASIQLMLAIRHPGLVRWIAAAGLTCVVVLNTAEDVHWMRLYPKQSNFTNDLQADLSRIGISSLQNSIQCLDLVDGCLTALYHLKLVQSTGSTGDLLLFLPRRSWVVDDARSKFLKEMNHSPPNVIVLSNAPFQGGRTFNIVETFPALAEFLKQKYALTIQREFCGIPSSHPGADSACPAYRIYQVKSDGHISNSIVAP